MRPEKKSITEEIKKRLSDSSYVLLVDYRGMTVQQLTDLRGRLHQKQARLQVVANSLLVHASRELGWDSRFEGLVNGPIAIVTGHGDVSEVAKILRGASQETKLLAVRGGRLERTLLSPPDVEQIASLPPRMEMLAKFVGTVAAPMSQLVGVLGGKLRSLLYVLKAIEEKKAPSAG